MVSPVTGDRNSPLRVPPSHLPAPPYPPAPPFGWRLPTRGVSLTATTIQPAKLSDPAVRAFVTAVNAHDRDGFLSLLTENATMSDDGSDRELTDWIDREIFTSNGHLDV